MDLAGGINSTGPNLRLYGSLLYLKYDLIYLEFKVQQFCIFLSRKTGSAVGEGKHFYLIAVDPHKRRQTDK